MPDLATEALEAYQESREAFRREVQDWVATHLGRALPLSDFSVHESEHSSEYVRVIIDGLNFHAYEGCTQLYLQRYCTLCGSTLNAEYVRSKIGLGKILAKNTDPRCHPKCPKPPKRRLNLPIPVFFRRERA